VLRRPIETTSETGKIWSEGGPFRPMAVPGERFAELSSPRVKLLTRGKFGGPCACPGTVLYFLPLPNFLSKSFVFKHVVAKEGLPREKPSGLGAGDPRFKSGRPDQTSNRNQRLTKAKFSPSME
jgi:hypothetical protein